MSTGYDYSDPISWITVINNINEHLHNIEFIKIFNWLYEQIQTLGLWIYKTTNTNSKWI